MIPKCGKNYTVAHLMSSVIYTVQTHCNMESICFM